MKQEIPNISYERSMNHNYLILSTCDFFGKKDVGSNDYRTKMLLENHIPGLLPVTHRLINGESRYYYEINSLQSLDRLYDKTGLGYDALRRLLSGCVSLFDRLEEYLLDGAQIIMKPEFIYMNVDKMEPYFVCYPEYEGDVRLAFMEFIDALLTKLDHTDERAVMIGYQVYRYTRNPNYVMSEVGRMMEQVMTTMTEHERSQPQKCSMGESAMSAKNRSCYTQEENDAYEYQNPNMQGQEYRNPNRQENERGSLNRLENECRNPGRQEQITEMKCHSDNNKSNHVVNLIGGVFCLFVSLCAGAIVLGARILKAFELSRNSELYLYGALAMAITAGLLFLSCYLKKRKQGKELERLGGDRDTDYFCHDEFQDGDYQYYTSAEPYKSELASREYTQSKTYKSELTSEEYALGKPYKNELPSEKSNKTELYKTQRSQDKQGVKETIEKVYNRDTSQKSYDETVCLGNQIVEERVLCGRMNGREITIPLDTLPMIVGKLPSVSDLVLNDTTVSKMHARFEERDGKVYVCDLNSTNGTVRNGVLLGINQSVALEPGDKLRFGRTCFTYC